MLVEVKVPPLAESVADATLMSWYKQVGDFVHSGENLIDLETDKVTLEVAAPEDGVITEIKKSDGETALSDEVLAVIDTEAKAPERAAADDEPPATETARRESEPEHGTASAKTSPAVRKLMADGGLKSEDLSASGKGGRITKADVVAHLQTRAEPSGAAAGAEPQASGPRAEERVAMTRLRKRAAERLLAAQHQNAMLTTFNEVNMAPVMALRARYKESFQREHGTKLGFMSFFVKAAVEALKRFPIVNASVEDEDIVYHGYYDVGIAVSAPRGLVVPVLRDADSMSFAQIEESIRAFGERARDSRLSIEELTGGTFTITNGGIFGSLVSTPIINPPQSAILGMHKIQDRPVAEDGAVVIRPMMYLALTYDHRIIDGREAVQFLVVIKEQLEDPARMLLQI